MLQSINPFNNELLREYNEHTTEEIIEIIDLTHQAYLVNLKSSFEERSEKMLTAAELLRSQREELSILMTQEMGKPIIQSRAEVDKCAWVCEYYAKNAANFLSDEIVETDATKSFITYNSIGIVLAVMPWNFPFWQVFRFAAPNLMAGNAGLLKHASNVSGCALAIEKNFEEAGFEKNLFRTILASSSNVKAVIENPKIKAVTLTGSTPAGKSIASTAGNVLKKTVLELGGSDPYVILKDADLEQTVNACVIARLINGGQSCIAGKRFIVVEEIYDDFVSLFCEVMKSKKMGDPMNEVNDLGPQAKTELRDELHRQVLKSIEMGAQKLLGGFIPDHVGAFYPPTILTDVRPGMPAYDEELFGPVASVIKAIDQEDAIRIANDTPFGLGAAVFSQNLALAESIAKNNINAGSCFVNTFVKSDPRLPFGGINESGYGRELSPLGIKEFVNIKTVFIK
ncbi:MAG TPA: NAD-dependent succinate-semialdehyde dehydrogenase [Ignavibacteriaceae bacterium]|nr:NAD-dependent succinate-semialdehyde dehydrogenase [Ignavibacteriaceae bacterium]